MFRWLRIDDVYRRREHRLAQHFHHFVTAGDEAAFRRNAIILVATQAIGAGIEHQTKREGR